MAWGLTAVGFSLKPTTQCIDDANASLLANLSPTLNLTAASATGQIVGTTMAAVGEVWQLGQAIYSALDPDQASGDQLASLALLTGTKKRAATPSVAKACTVNLNPGTYAVGALTAYPTNSPTSVFANLTAVTNGGGSAANSSVDFGAVTAGPTLAPAGTIVVIASPVSGFNSITNPTDAIAGLPLEADPQLRTRRAAALQSGGGSTAGAIQAAIINGLGVAQGGDVVQCTVLSNDTDTTDASGHPPHSFEAIVLGVVADSNADNAVAATIAATRTAGDTAYGTNRSIIVTDSQGNPHTIGFTRPTTVPIYITITVQHDPTSPFTPTIASVQAALVAWSQTALGSGGQAVVIERIKSIALSVPGAFDVTACFLGTAPSPAGTVNVPISIRQIATLSSSNVVVTIT